MIGIDRPAQVVFAFEWNYCTHESSFAIESLHLTKAGAWKAMRTKLLAWATQAREDSLLFGGDFTARHSQAWRVRAYEVQP